MKLIIAKFGKQNYQLRTIFLFWRISANCLPTTMNLRRRGLGVCGNKEETHAHLILFCDSAHRMWFSESCGADWAIGEEASGFEVMKLVFIKEQLWVRDGREKNEILIRTGVIFEEIWRCGGTSNVQSLNIQRTISNIIASIEERCRAMEAKTTQTQIRY